jgi:ribosomal protein S18 acetylase RimI-like enzyme
VADTAPDLTIRRAAAHDRAVLTALAWRLTAFPLPAWRTPGSIAAADARDMLNVVGVNEGAPPGAAPDAEVFIAERNREAVGCLHMLVTTDFFGGRHAHISVIATTEAAEGSGVGRALIAHA